MEKKEAHVKMSITFSWNAYNNWYEVEIIKYEIKGYGFERYALKTHSDPNGIVNRFYQKFHSTLR